MKKLKRNLLPKVFIYLYYIFNRVYIKIHILYFIGAENIMHMKNQLYDIIMKLK